MAGMISQAQGAPAQESAPQQPQAAGQEQAADSQEAYDVATGQMLNFVYDQSGIEALTELVQSTGDPQAGMARLFGRLLIMTTQSAVISGKRIAPQLVFQGGIEVIRALSEVAQAQGLLAPEQEKEVTEAAFYDGIALFATEAKEEALTNQEREQYAALLEQAEQMEQEARGGQPSEPQPAKEATA